MSLSTIQTSMLVASVVLATFSLSHSCFLFDADVLLSEGFVLEDSGRTILKQHSFLFTVALSDSRISSFNNDFTIYGFCVSHYNLFYLSLQHSHTQTDSRISRKRRDIPKCTFSWPHRVCLPVF